MKKGIVILSAVILGAASAQSSRAAVMAVVDSGTDINHPELANKIWNNPKETDDAVDNDDNGYVDDLHGWNFVDNNNKLINKKLIGTFSQDDYKYFDLQTKALEGTATADEIAWLKAKVKDDKFVAGLEDFGNFVHGTHVAGVMAKDADQAKLMILKVIGSKTADAFTRFATEHQAEIATQNASGGGISDTIIHAGLDYLAQAQGQGLSAPAQYLAAEKPRVANCSFGSSAAAVKPLLKQLIEGILHKPVTDAQLDEYANYFLNKTIKQMEKSFIDVSPETLFVIAAGNDGTDNDKIPTAPANVKTENTIAVAATLGHSKLASFSNFGATMVDIAAPGVGILSTVPGAQHMQLSGTSQAAPYVSNLAGRIMDENPHLTISEVKLILMETVDKKPFLENKVRSAGIANPDRAVYAAKLSLTSSVSEAISRANREVHEVVPDFYESLFSGSDEEGAFSVLPLPSLIQ